MAFLRPLAKPKCRCGRTATRELVNRRNATVGYFCAPCGRSELERHLVFERRDQAVDDGSYSEEIS